MTSKSPLLPSVGWWEWVRLPGFDHKSMKAKCDTGASLSALHATNLDIISRGDTKIARFQLEPEGKRIELTILKVIEVKSSNGESQGRPVVLIPVEFAGQIYAIECTLTDRTPMSYDMLLGRNALAGKFVVDSSRQKIHPKPRYKR